MYWPTIDILSQISRPYIPGRSDLSPFAPECWIIATLVALLLTPFFAKKVTQKTLLVAILGLLISLIACFYSNGSQPTDVLPLKGILISDGLSRLWKILLLIFVIGIVLLWAVLKNDREKPSEAPEFAVLLIGATLGMMLMASTTNLLMMVIAIELASLPSYVLVGFRKTHKPGAEAALKYVLFGAACSSVMIYGLSLLYGLTGTLDLAVAASALSTGTMSPALLAVALLGLTVGIGFKISAAPFHFWCPDVFQGATIQVGAFLSVASKGAGLILLARIILTLSPAGAIAGWPVQLLLTSIGVLAALTMIVGNTAALRQDNLKRLLAWSSIAQAGYMMCALVALNRSTHAPAMLLFYLATYLFMNLGAFAILGIVARASSRDDIAGFNGLSSRSPWLAHAMAACLISLIGLPPFAGFIAKFNIIALLIETGSWAWALVALVVLNTVISLYYYARVLRAMYLTPATLEPVRFNLLGGLLSIGSATVLLILFIFAGKLQSILDRSISLQINKPAIVVLQDKPR